MNRAQKDWFQYALAALLCIGEFAVLISVIWVWVSGPSTLDSSVVNLVYGLSMGYHSAFMAVVGYFFGSSKGSSEKNDIITGTPK